jgi:hypothetical protein
VVGPARTKPDSRPAGIATGKERCSMWFRISLRVLTVLAVAAVLVAAVTLFPGFRAIDALLMVILLAVLNSLYGLRRRARVVLLDSRPEPHRRHAADGNAGEGTSAVDPVSGVPRNGQSHLR